MVLYNSLILGINIEVANQNQKSNIDEGKKKAGKYVFQCQKCGQCCEGKDSVIVTLADIGRWNNDLTLPSLYPYLTIELVGENLVQLSLRKVQGNEEEQIKGCPLYDAKNNICNIYFSMPLFCSSFPLGYDGQNFYIKDKSCTGIGRGTMTQDSLERARNLAKEDHEAQVSTYMLLPVIHGLTLGFILDQSKKKFEQLSPEQKKQLDEILNEQKTQDTSH